MSGTRIGGGHAGSARRVVERVTGLYGVKPARRVRRRARAGRQRENVAPASVAVASPRRVELAPIGVASASDLAGTGRSHDRIGAPGRRRRARRRSRSRRKAPPPGSIAGLRTPTSRSRPRSVARSCRRRSSVGPGSSRSGTTTTALDRFLADDPLAAQLASGWRARLEPLRRTERGPASARASEAPPRRSRRPVAALTMGRPRASQLIRFLRTSAKAEASVVGRPGLTWTTGLARPPSFVATCSLWESTRCVVDVRVRQQGSRAPRRDRER